MVPEGDAYDLPYDHLVVALGASTNDWLIPGSSNALTFKTMADALVLRNHLIEQFERADAAANAVQRRACLTVVVIGGGLVGVPSFNTDRMHILDARTGAIDPEPFFAPLAVGPGRPLFDGLQIVAARPGRRGVDFRGPDLFALTGQASELIPIELRKVLGP